MRKPSQSESGLRTARSAKPVRGKKRIIGSSVGFSILLLLLGAAFVSGQQESPCSVWNMASRTTRVSEEDIKRLLIHLAHPDKSVRSKAYRRLLEIGPRAITTQLDATKQLDFNVRYWCFRKGLPTYLRLVKEIQSKYGIQPVRMNGLEFLPVTNSVWTMPPAGKSKNIRVGLKITNTGDPKLKIHPFNTISFALYDDKGNCQISEGGRDFPPAWMSSEAPVLCKGRNFIVISPNTNLSRSQDGKRLTLRGDDGWVTFVYPELGPGQYYLVFRICHSRRDPPGHDTQNWIGDCQTSFVSVEIKRKTKGSGVD